MNSGIEYIDLIARIYTTAMLGMGFLGVITDHKKMTKPVIMSLTALMLAMVYVWR